MMKRLIVVAVLLMCLATAASATMDDKWVVQLRVTDLVGASYGTTNTYGFGAPSSATGSLIGAIVMVYVTGTDPKTVKSVIAAPGQPYPPSVVWNLTVEASATYQSTKFRLSAWNPTGTLNDMDATFGDAAPGMKLKIYKGASMEYQFNPALNGTSALPQWTKEYDIAAGGKIQDFRLVLEIPEPGSIVALASGLIGLVGFGIRRRR